MVHNPLPIKPINALWKTHFINCIFVPVSFAVTYFSSEKNSRLLLLWLAQIGLTATMIKSKVCFEKLWIISRANTKKIKTTGDQKKLT